MRPLALVTRLFSRVCPRVCSRVCTRVCTRACTAVFAAGIAGIAGFAAGCPSQECRDYVACQTAYDDSVNVDRYRDGGACWGSLQASQLCTAQCKEALAALAEVPSPPPECTLE